MERCCECEAADRPSMSHVHEALLQCRDGVTGFRPHVGPVDRGSVFRLVASQSDISDAGQGDFGARRRGGGGILAKLRGKNSKK